MCKFCRYLPVTQMVQGQMPSDFHNQQNGPPYFLVGSEESVSGKNLVLPLSLFQHQSPTKNPVFISDNKNEKKKKD